MIDEHEQPQAVLCVKMGDRLPQSMRFVMEDQKSDDVNSQVRYTIFYSVFRLKQTTVKGAGAIIIKLVKEYYKAKSIKRFYTLSPITDLTQRFQSFQAKQILSGIYKAAMGTCRNFMWETELVFTPFTSTPT